MDSTAVLPLGELASWHAPARSCPAMQTATRVGRRCMRVGCGLSSVKVQGLPVARRGRAKEHARHLHHLMWSALLRHQGSHWAFLVIEVDMMLLC